jgi:hypothetical protein
MNSQIGRMLLILMRRKNTNKRMNLKTMRKKELLAMKKMNNIMDLKKNMVLSTVMNNLMMPSNSIATQINRTRKGKTNILISDQAEAEILILEEITITSKIHSNSLLLVEDIEKVIPTKVNLVEKILTLMDLEHASLYKT